ncbi:transporter [Stutzerimonas stutzeri]|uniref:transporter n=1 Tax=Stutzerimonas stutzeri TaxID=316 RepID=UPI00210D394E|nr:transporter [Stutzerimonas stutzeri]MCQ4321644.1 transporter [Stutzerimonas stutzeri]
MKNNQYFVQFTIAVQCFMLCTAVYAQGLQPHDFVPAPAGTHLGLLYYFGSTSDTLVDGDGHEVKDSSLDSNVGLLRYVYYFDIGDMRADVNVLQPFGSLNNMRVGGSDIDTDDFSMGDLTLVGTIWPLNDPENERYFAIATYLTLPSGNYSSSEPGLGSNRWSTSIQPAFLTRIAPQWTVDLAGDITFYGDNDDGPDGANVDKDPSFTALGWLNYQATATTMLSLGGTTTWGGEEKIKGDVRGSDVKTTTIRAAWTQMLNPKTQFLLEVGHDVDAQSAYERDVEVILRLAKFF